MASGIPYASNLTFDARGGMWVTSGAPFDQSGDGVWYVPARARKPVHVIRGTLGALGLTWFRGRLYVASTLERGHRDRGALLGLRRARASPTAAS